MRYFLTLIFFTCTLIAIGQDTTFYDNDFNKVSTLNEATYYDVVTRDMADTNKVQVKSYHVSGQIKSESYYSDYAKKKRDGKYRSWYESGQLHTVIDYKNGFMFGQILTYWENGQPKRIDNYYDGKFVDGKCMTSAGIDTVHFAYEIFPQFPGGDNELMKFITKEIKYPRSAKENGIQGSVMVGFIINKDGTISDIKIINSVDKRLDAEAMRVIHMMVKWEPGLQDGTPVRVSYRLPINFQLR